MLSRRIPWLQHRYPNLGMTRRANRLKLVLTHSPTAADHLMVHHPPPIHTHPYTTLLLLTSVVPSQPPNTQPHPTTNYRPPHTSQRLSMLSALFASAFGFNFNLAPRLMKTMAPRRAPALEVGSALGFGRG